MHRIWHTLDFHYIRGSVFYANDAYKRLNKDLQIVTSTNVLSLRHLNKTEKTSFCKSL